VGGRVAPGHCFRLFFTASPSSSSPPGAASPAAATNSIAVRNPIPSHEKDLIRRERRDRECSPGSSGSKGPSSSSSPPLRGASGAGRSGRRRGMTKPGWIRGTDDRIHDAEAGSAAPTARSAAPTTRSDPPRPCPGRPRSCFARAAASVCLGLRVATSVRHALEARRSSHEQSSGGGEEGGGGCRWWCGEGRGRSQERGIGRVTMEMNERASPVWRHIYVRVY